MKKKKPVPRGPYKKKAPAFTPVDTNIVIDGLAAYMIEEVPPAYGGTRTMAAQAAVANVEKILPGVKPGMAFLIPKQNRHVILRYLTEHHSAYRFVVAKVLGNDSLLRVYKQEYKKSK